jgi:hypothetical protein
MDTPGNEPRVAIDRSNSPYPSYPKRGYIPPLKIRGGKVGLWILVLSSSMYGLLRDPY